MRLLVALVVWVAAVGAAAGLSSVVADNARTEATSASSGSSSFNASAVNAPDTNSLFHTANLRRALNLARAHLGPSAKTESLTIYPGYLVFSQVTGATETDVYIDASGRFDATDGGSHIGNSPLFALSRVPVDTPARLERRIASATHTPLSQLHYMIFEPDSTTGRLHWLLYTVPGNPITYFQAAGAHGRLFKLGHGGLEPVRG